MIQRQSDDSEFVQPQVSLGLARNEIERLFNDERLHLSKRNKAFLQYLAEQYYAGNQRRVKAYAIAVDVFGRPEDFDPVQDPIVRIEAARLRAELERYYDTHAGCSDVCVKLRRGHYVVEFSYVANATTPGSKDERNSDSRVPGDSERLRSLRALAVSSTRVVGWPFMKLAATCTQLVRHYGQRNP